jgi:hypothetical protein
MVGVDLQSLSEKRLRLVQTPLEEAAIPHIVQQFDVRRILLERRAEMNFGFGQVAAFGQQNAQAMMRARVMRVALEYRFVHLDRICRGAAALQLPGERERPVGRSRGGGYKWLGRNLVKDLRSYTSGQSQPGRQTQSGGGKKSGKAFGRAHGGYPFRRDQFRCIVRTTCNDFFEDTGRRVYFAQTYPTNAAGFIAQKAWASWRDFKGKRMRHLWLLTAHIARYAVRKLTTTPPQRQKIAAERDADRPWHWGRSGFQKVLTSTRWGRVIP